MKRGLVDIGDALSDDDYDAKIYLGNTDGTLADAVGTVTVTIGRVAPMFGDPDSTDKLLWIDIKAV